MSALGFLRLRRDRIVDAMRQQYVELSANPPGGNPRQLHLTEDGRVMSPGAAAKLSANVRTTMIGAYNRNATLACMIEDAMVAADELGLP